MCGLDSWEKSNFIQEIQFDWTCQFMLTWHSFEMENMYLVYSLGNYVSQTNQAKKIMWVLITPFWSTIKSALNSGRFCHYYRIAKMTEFVGHQTKNWVESPVRVSFCLLCFENFFIWYYIRCSQEALQFVFSVNNTNRMATKVKKIVIITNTYTK